MNNRNSGNGKTGLIILSVICIALIAVSFISSSAMTPLTAATGFVISPIQKGMNSLGSFLSVTLPIWVISLILISLLCLRLPKERLEVFLGEEPLLDRKSLTLYALLFLLCTHGEWQKDC